MKMKCTKCGFEEELPGSKTIEELITTKAEEEGATVLAFGNLLCPTCVEVEAAGPLN